MSRRLFSRALTAGAVGALAAWVLWSHETLTTTVLFDREIVRILDKHCVMCHFENGRRPLETYEQTRLQKRTIHLATISRHMPPWDAVPGYASSQMKTNRLCAKPSSSFLGWKT